MVKGLYTGYTGMVNEQKRMDVIANNLANSATTGYKKEGMVNQSFDHELAIKIKDTSNYNMPQRIGSISLGVKVGETYTNWDQGSFQITENMSDLALSGEGYFAIAFKWRDFYQIYQGWCVFCGQRRLFAYIGWRLCAEP